MALIKLTQEQEYDKEVLKPAAVTQPSMKKQGRRERRNVIYAETGDDISPQRPLQKRSPSWTHVYRTPLFLLNTGRADGSSVLLDLERERLHWHGLPYGLPVSYYTRPPALVYAKRCYLKKTCGKGLLFKVNDALANTVRERLCVFLSNVYDDDDDEVFQKERRNSRNGKNKNKKKKNEVKNR
eukprot:gene12209-8401_t